MSPDTELHEAMKGLKKVLWRDTRYEGVQWYYAEERLYVLRVRTGRPNEHYRMIKARCLDDAIRGADYNMKTAEECGGREMSFETKEDIVREMRIGATGDMPFAYQVGIADTIEEFPSGAKMRKINIKKVTVKELADRFEEAFKHEKVNAGALLKALEEIRDRAVGGVYSGSIDCHEIIKIAEKALAAPARKARQSQ